MEGSFVVRRNFPLEAIWRNATFITKKIMFLRIVYKDQIFDVQHNKFICVNVFIIGFTLQSFLNKGSC